MTVLRVWQQESLHKICRRGCQCQEQVDSDEFQTCLHWTNIFHCQIQENKQQYQEVYKKLTRQINLVPVPNLNEANSLLEVALMSQERILDPLYEVWLNLVLPFISFLVSQTCLSLDQRMKMRRGRREWNRSIDASLLGFLGNCSRRWWCERHETTERNERLPNALWRSEVHSKI